MKKFLPWRSRYFRLSSLIGIIAWIVYLSVRWAPVRVRYWLLLPLAWAIYVFRRGRVLENLAAARPEWSREELEVAGRRLVRTMCRSWAFLLGRNKVDREEILSRVSGAAKLLSHCAAGGKAVVWFTHTGGVNELVPAIAALEIEVFAPAEAIPPLLYRLMNRRREQYGNIELSPVRGDATIAASLRKLDEGKIVVLAADIPPGRTGRGVTVRIGAAQTQFAAGAVKIALLADAPIFFALPYYDEKGRAKLSIEGPHKLRSTGNLEADIGPNAEQIASRIANHIEAYLPDWWRLLFEKLQPVG